MENVPVQVNNQAHVEHNANARTSDQSRHFKVKKNRTKFVAIVVGIILVLAIIVSAGLFFYRTSVGSTIETDKYQAVFFTNGQVYFGKLHPLNSDYMKLTDIFYLQAKTSSTNPQQTSDQTTTGVDLIKLGNEIHGPEDAMIISKSQILFFENLKNDSKVSSTIIKYEKK
ncbi:MAG TPA: hypothetical protein VMR16_02150 [Candidatus Saccharimonadales bacterium]|nr:hypothetical protein [Candidatus Saccharimonadales bacterium]